MLPGRGLEGGMREPPGGLEQRSHPGTELGPFGAHHDLEGRLGAVQEATVLLTEHAHLRRMAEHRDHLSARLIESQGEVRPQTVRCPARDLSVRRTIHDCDLVRVGNVHEDALAGALELKALRVCPQRNIRYLRSTVGVDDG